MKTKITFAILVAALLVALGVIFRTPDAHAMGVCVGITDCRERCSCVLERCLSRCGGGANGWTCFWNCEEDYVGCNASCPPA